MTDVSLHLVRIPFSPRALVAFAVDSGVDDDDRGYAAHLALRRRFGSGAPQPFRMFADGVAGPHLLGYATDVAALLDAAALPPIDPTLEAIFPLAPSIRPMPEVWRRGARFAFEVRVRPIVRYGPRARAARLAEGKRAAAERDVFLAAAELASGETLDRGSVYRDWLVRQLAGAAVVERSAITGMRRIVTRRSTHRRAGAARIEGYEAVFAGLLAVEQADAFARTLARGIGRHAAFGFGMLALAPPRPL